MPAEEMVMLERLPLPKGRFLVALLDRYRRNVKNDIIHMERLEALPTYIGRRHGQRPMEGMVEYEDWDLWYDTAKASYRMWMARHRDVKARLDAGLWLEEDDEEDWEAPIFAFSESRPATFTFRP